MFEKAEKVRRYFKVALWGDKKSGKTRGALSFPKPCVIDGERGTLMYTEKHDFSVRDVNSWKGMLDTIDFLADPKNKDHGFETLVIDPLTIFWQDLCDQQVDYVRNRRGNEILSTGDWGMIKRRWKNFLNKVNHLNMHVVLVMRAKDEYETTIDKTGEEKSRKTGDHMPDAEKSTGYVFDFILHMFTVEDKKNKVSRHFVEIEGSRRDELPKYHTVDITKRNLYKAVFKPLEKVMAAPKASSKKAAKKKDSPPKAPPPESSKPGTKSATEAIGALLQMFGTSDSNEPKAKGEDIKVLMTRAAKLRWFDDAKFNSKDGKALIKALFKVDSTKDLKKSQADFLYKQFGEVLANRASLARDEKGVPFIQPNGNLEAAESAT